MERRPKKEVLLQIADACAKHESNQENPQHSAQNIESNTQSQNSGEVGSSDQATNQQGAASASDNATENSTSAKNQPTVDGATGTVQESVGRVPQQNIAPFWMCPLKHTLITWAEQAAPLPEEQQSPPVPSMPQTAPQAANEEVKLCTALPPHLLNKKYYKNFSNPKGLAVIFNNWNFLDPNLPQRKGSEEDCIAMEKVLIKMGYIVNVHQDLLASEMVKVLNEFAADPRHEKCDSGVVVIMTHGNDREQLYAKDGLPIDKQFFFNKLNGTNCDGLFGKPKLFFIQACRGNLGDEGAAFETDSVTVSVERDYFVLQSAAAGYASFRCPCNGSPFIQHLVDVLAEQAHEKNLNDLSREVMDRVGKHMFIKHYKQQPEITRDTLKCEFYFLPGYHVQPI